MQVIPREYIEELTQRSDILDVIQGYVQLRHRGRTHTGLCPFHGEKTPSFVVYPETQSFYCFGCGAGGDVVTFVKRIDNVDYIEAVKTLAARAGMPLPQEDDKTGRLRSKVVSINKDTARFFVNQLNSDSGKYARRYWVEQRGLSAKTITRFGLGYAPDEFGVLLNYLQKLGYTEEEMLASGVIRKSEKGNLYDMFRGRAMIPIIDLRGNVIAFSGRDFTSEKPQRKYVNSPETMVYKKSRTLFALNFAKKTDSKKYILCEGNLDAISMHQAGFCTAVAGCGTALTSEQVKLLSEYAQEVVLCYDSDEAGQKATAKAINLFAQTDIKVSVLNLPDAKDPDEFIKKFGAERFEMVLNGASNATEYELLKVKAKYDLAQADGRVGYLKDAVNILAGRMSPTERDVYAGRLAEDTNVDKTAIVTQLNGALRAKNKRLQKQREQALLQEGAGMQIKVPYTQGGQKALGVAFAEQQIVAIMLKKPEYIETMRDRLHPESFLDAGMGKACTLLLQHSAKGEYAELSMLVEELPDETISLISRVLAQNYDAGFSKQDVEWFLQRLENSVPMSSTAAQASTEELAEYFQSLSEKLKTKGMNEA